MAPLTLSHRLVFYCFFLISLVTFFLDYYYFLEGLVAINIDNSKIMMSLIMMMIMLIVASEENKKNQGMVGISGVVR